MLQIYPLGGKPEGVDISPDGKVVYVSASAEDEVTVISTDSKRPIARFTADKGPRGIAFSPEHARVYHRQGGGDGFDREHCGKPDDREHQDRCAGRGADGRGRFPEGEAGIREYRARGDGGGHRPFQRAGSRDYTAWRTAVGVAVTPTGRSSTVPMVPQ